MHARRTSCVHCFVSLLACRVACGACSAARTEPMTSPVNSCSDAYYRSMQLNQHAELSATTMIPRFNQCRTAVDCSGQREVAARPALLASRACGAPITMLISSCAAPHSTAHPTSPAGCCTRTGSAGSSLRPAAQHTSTMLGALLCAHQVHRACAGPLLAFCKRTV
jgi:hypothetical protein